ncbi:nucleoside-diphosphate-sugar epimerase [Sinimarinibacterium flocculans]|uniref:Nucleoside-diphosphate-sugar epimerase n=1 Tax=Sinimarinibacterium flocculans TaxID=985250 RepID=A0A318E715_9GAMM|nr:NAD-dependent epimerase/dehydratase family protein [Sinimarinibacterium flocculans]PXV64613.1 nucleoside-diphosphate-sugar epimerase [Sinimarinibacterium flocculans]
MALRILVVGGTGLIGGHAALHLRTLGHTVHIAARHPPPAATPMAALPFAPLDYLHAEADALAGFDALVFCAGNDIRHVPPDADADAHWQRANAEGVPRFFSQARDAGIRRAVLVGSFYPQAMPALVDRDAYVRGRKLADDGARALAGDDFAVCSVNAPFVAGTVPGLVVPGLAAHAAYALGRLPQIPPFAIPGGVNFMSTRSLSEAIAGALQRGAPGHAYLVGDENLGFADYFGALFRAAGRNDPLPVLDREHPLLPDAILYAGRGGTIHYEPDAAETALLGYRRGDMQATLSEIVAFYRDAT